MMHDEAAFPLDVTSAARQDVTHRDAEVERQKRVQQRVERTGEVVDDEGDGRQQELPEWHLRAAPGLPQQADVVGQRAHGEGHDDGDQEADHLAPREQRALRGHAAVTPHPAR